MPVTNLPEVFSARFIDNFQSSMVYADAITNVDYQAEVAGFGASIVIPDFRNLTVDIFDYNEDVGLDDPTFKNHNVKTLLIDQRKAFNLRVDRIEEVMSNLNKVEAMMRKSAQSMAATQDSFIANTYSQAASAIGDDLGPIALDRTNVYENLVKLSTALDENDVPPEDRAVVLSPSAIALLRQADLFTRENDVVRNGYIADACGFRIYSSNRVPTSGGTQKLIAGHKSAVAFVSVLDELEQMTHPNFFGTQIRGLSLYGLAVTRPESLAVLTATIA